MTVSTSGNTVPSNSFSRGRCLSQWLSRWVLLPQRPRRMSWPAICNPTPTASFGVVVTMMNCRSRLAGDEALKSWPALKAAIAGKPAPTRELRCAQHACPTPIPCRSRLAGDSLFSPATSSFAEM
ncbi:hypothetical protein EMIT0P44_30189 [Pseudomonas sp. IT-P44]